MTESAPFLTSSTTILWLKVTLTATALVLLYLRYRRARTSGVSSKALPLGTRAMIVLAVLFSFAVFHNLGTFGGGTFVHEAEMFHYYLGSKYFKELGYYELYNAVIVADTEQGNALAGLPFYTDLRNYQNTRRETALHDADRVKNLFSRDRWAAFKADVAFFKEAASPPRSPPFFFVLMDHGYNASPASTFILGTLTNVVPVSQLQLLAVLDVLVVVTMMVLVLRTFGLEMGALFSIYFFVNILSGQEYLSGSLLRYDWLFYIVVAVCLLERGRHASSAFFLTLSAMLRVFPAVLFYGLAVAVFQKARTTGTVDRKYGRFGLAAGATALALFLLPAASFGGIAPALRGGAMSMGPVLQPWKDFYAKAQLHDRGVYVNHVGLKAIALFEPSHLSLERFADAYKSADTNDIVRHWQDVKEQEFARKRPAIVFSSFLVLVGLTAIIWRRKEGETEGLLWSLPLIYTTSYLSNYYYAFLCLFVLLFFRRADSLRGFVPLCLLLSLNIAALVTDSFGPSPIVFFTLVNVYVFICLASILGFELYTSVFMKRPMEAVASSSPPHEPRSDARWRRRRARPRRK